MNDSRERFKGYASRPIAAPARTPHASSSKTAAATPKSSQRRFKLPAIQLQVFRKKLQMVSKWLFQNLDPRPYQGLQRVFRSLALLGTAAVLCFSVVMPILTVYLNHERYKLDDKTQAIVGVPNPNLASKLTFDAAKAAYVFNKAGLAAAPQTTTDAGDPSAKLKQLQAQLGGSGKTDKSLYSVQMPTDPTKGISYYDNNLGLSFSMISQFAQAAPKEVDNHIVYPASNGTDVIYTAKNNGLKEDLVLDKMAGDTANFSYRLVLPDTLEARLMDDGSLGIYSADPSLFGNISYSSPGDQATVMKARTANDKNNLVFAIPAPTIKQSGAAGQGSAAASFYLDGNTLTVKASGLAKLSYPVSIDPSVVVTSTNDFGTGNDEGDIDFGTANEIDRATVTGGTISSGWTTATNNFTNARGGNASVVYNGRLYMLGGSSFGGTLYNDVQYTTLNSDGSLGTWTTSANPFNTARSYFGAVAYDGYLYVLGGQHSGSASTVCAAVSSLYCDTVQYAAISPVDGSIGSWTTSATPLPAARSFLGATVYDGFLYIAGGYTTSSEPTDVTYTPLKATGDTGAWTASPNQFSTGRVGANVLAYNNALYIVGGLTGSYDNTVQEAIINADGSIGAFTTTASFVTGRAYASSVIYKGYMYIYGGTGGSGDLTDVQFAAVNADGSLAPWYATASFAATRSSAATAAYNGYIYSVGGEGPSTTPLNTTLYAPIDSAGMTSTYQTSAATGFVAHRDTCSTVYNGTIYVLGGTTGTTPSYTNDGYYASIGTTGDLGTWTVMDKTNLTVGTNLWSARGAAGCFAFGNYLFVAVGQTGSGTYANDIWKIKLNTDGTLPVHVTSGTQDAWTSVTTAMYSGGAREGISMFVYGGDIYAVGGDNGTTWYTSANIVYTSIDQFGTTGGSWTSLTSVPHAHSKAGVALVDKYIYVMGGADSSSTRSNVIDIGTVTYSGSTPTVSWVTSSTNLPASVTGMGAAAYNGYLYISGGYDGTSYRANTYYSLVNVTTGAIGSWVSTPALATGRAFGSVVAANGYFYAIAGQIDATGDNTAANEYAVINNGGSGVTSTWTTSTTTLSNPSATGWANGGTGYKGLIGMSTLIYNNYLYVLGGSDGNNWYNNVEYAPINNDGSLGSWTDSANKFPSNRYIFASTICNGYMYVMGGSGTGGAKYGDTQYAKINSDGSLGTWNAGANLPTTSFSTYLRSGNAAACLNGYVYELGGYDGTNRLGDVIYAQPSSTTGNIASWTVSGNSIPNGNSNMAIATYNNYIYLMGGGNSPDQDSAYYASVNPSTGAISAWQLTTPLISSVYDATATTLDGYIYLFGGQLNSTTTYNETQFAPIYPDGTIGTWQSSTNTFSTARWRAASVATAGRVYVIGGNNGTAGPANVALKDIQYASLSAIPRVGVYSKLFDFGSMAKIGSITYNGTLPGGLGTISYRMAGIDGVLDTTARDAFYLSGVGSCVTGNVSGRYALISITMDGSQSGVFPDSASTANAQLTDFTVNFSAATHPSPSVRLRTGGSFLGQTLLPLDTCGV